MTMPQLATKTALTTLPERTVAGKKRVGLFLGCLINYVYPEIARATITLLEQTGHTIIIPKQQVCCGLAALYLGDIAAFRYLCSKNIRTFQRLRLDAIVTACASCGTALKEEYRQWAGSNSAEPFGVKVYDISEYLIKAGLSLRKVDEKVTYHDPCHLRSSQGIWKEPRKLLSRATELVELEEPWRCCGGGGTFSIFYKQLSLAIGKEKSDTIQQSGVRTVVTGCPGCILQLRTILPSNFSVKHTVEVLNSSLHSESHK